MNRVRRLSMERLERREVLAAAVLQMQFLADDAGQPGAPISQVPTDESFFVEILAEETHELYRGLGAVAVSLQWNPDQLTIDPSFDPRSAVTESLPFRRGSLAAEQGRLDDLSGSIFLNSGRPIGAAGPERFALLRFQAAGLVGAAEVTLAEGDSGVVLFPFASPTVSVQGGSITVVSAGPSSAAASSAATAPPTEVASELDAPPAPEATSPIDVAPADDSERPVPGMENEPPDDPATSLARLQRRLPAEKPPAAPLAPAVSTPDLNPNRAAARTTSRSPASPPLIEDPMEDPVEVVCFPGAAENQSHSATGDELVLMGPTMPEWARRFLEEGAVRPAPGETFTNDHRTQVSPPGHSLMLEPEAAEPEQTTPTTVQADSSSGVRLLLRPRAIRANSPLEGPIAAGANASRRPASPGLVRWLLAVDEELVTTLANDQVQSG